MNARIPCADRTGAPIGAGIGLRTCHFREILRQRPAIGWVEVHSENYFCDGGQPLHLLDKVRECYPVSLHGVGLSLGSAEPLDREHLARLRRLVGRIEPGLVSEHLSWSMAGGRHLNELLPLPCTDEALAVVAGHLDQVQDILGRQILVENISSYVGFQQSSMTEPAFLSDVGRPRVELGFRRTCEGSEEGEHRCRLTPLARRAPSGDTGPWRPPSTRPPRSRAPRTSGS